MALTDQNNMVMPVAPMYGGGNMGGIYQIYELRRGKDGEKISKVD